MARSKVDKVQSVADFLDQFDEDRFFQIEVKLFGKERTLWSRIVGPAQFMEFYNECFLQLVPQNGNGDTPGATITVMDESGEESKVNAAEAKAEASIQTRVVQWALVKWDDDGKPVDEELLDLRRAASIDGAETAAIYREILTGSGLRKEEMATAASFRGEPGDDAPAGAGQ